jgi:NAD(P)-dependent dehydrogenase (short-subunit alcohol dehydrogenase family)
MSTSRDVPWESPSSTTGHGMLAGRVAFVTGAGRNIGRAIALRLGAEGAAVAVNDVDSGNARAVVDELHAIGAHAVAAVGDASDFREIDRLFAEVERELGIVDLLVNNAYVRSGESAWGAFLAVTPADWALFVQNNMDMLFGCTQRAARGMAHAGLRGAIVNISSHGAERAHRNHIPYDSVKGATDAFTRAVAVDLAPWGIRVNAVRPGAIAVGDEPERWQDQQELRSSQIPLGRAGSSDDIASCVLFLASDESAYVTGQALTVDGGLLVQGRAPQLEGFAVARPETLGMVAATLLP